MIFTVRVLARCMAIVAVTASTSIAAQTTAPAAKVAPPAARVAPLAPLDRVRVLLAPGAETTLASPVTARIKALPVSLGAAFQQGQLLVGFDCDEPVARGSMAKAELDGAIEQHEAKVRMQGLDQASDVEVAMAASLVAKFRAQVALHKAQTQQCEVAAPWAGRVSKVHVKNFMSVTPGQPLVEIVMSGPLKLKLNVPSRWLAGLRAGTAFSVTVDENGRTYPARVSAINSRVDPVSQTIELEGSLTANFPELLAGMSGVASFPGFH